MEAIEDVLAEMEMVAGIVDSGPDDEVSAATVRDWVKRIRAIRREEQDDARGDALDCGD